MIDKTKIRSAIKVITSCSGVGQFYRLCVAVLAKSDRELAPALLCLAYYTQLRFVVHFISLYVTKKRKVQTYRRSLQVFMDIDRLLIHGTCLYIQPHRLAVLLSFYILFYAIGTYVSGSLIKFKPLKYGGLVCFPLPLWLNC